jgi:hypothetical protein
MIGGGFGSGFGTVLARFWQRVENLFFLEKDGFGAESWGVSHYTIRYCVDPN